MPNHEESLHQFARHTPRILRRQLILQLAELYLSGEKSDDVKDVVTCKPSIQRFNGALLFVDISGFTALSLRLNVEELKNHINEYFTKMLDIVDKHEGDVVKFAGDALFIIWECLPHESGDEESDFSRSAVEKAVECGKEINETCSNHKVVIHNFKPALRQSNSFQDLSMSSGSTNTEFSTLTPRTNSTRLSPINMRATSIEEEEYAYLNVHSGVSVGLMAGIDIGVENRWEYFLIGDPLSKVAEAEALAGTGELIICPRSHAALHPEQKTAFSGIVSAMRGLFRREATDPSKKKAITLSCGCVTLKDGYCKVNTGHNASFEKKKSRRGKGSVHSPQEEQQHSSLENIRTDVKEVYSIFQSRFMKEFLRHSKKSTHAINSSEDYELCDMAMQRTFFQWVESNLTDDIARHVHHVMRSEYTFSTTSRVGAYDRAIDEHFRRALMPCTLIASSDLFDEVAPSRSSPMLSPLSRNASPLPSRTASPVGGRLSALGGAISRTASPVQNRIAASIALAQTLSPRLSPPPSADSNSSSLQRVFSNSSNVTDGYSSDGSVSLAMRTVGKTPGGENRNHMVSSRLTLRRRGEGNLLMSSFSGGIAAKSPCMTAEIRTVNVLFIKLAMPPVELLVDSTKRVKLGGGNRFLGKSVNEKIADQLLLDRFQSSMEVLNEALTAHGGQMRQFIVDDKGTVCIGTFGLRGSVSDDNAAAAMEAAHAIIVKMQQMGLQCSIGVTVGKAYCGLVGSSGRHEYAVMGPSTNLSARLMCKAPAYGVICDGETRHRDRTHGFIALADVTAKGYSSPVPTFKPIFPEVEALLNAQQELSARVFRGLSVNIPSEDSSSRTASAAVGHHGGSHRKIIERMIGSKNNMVFRDSHNAKVKLHGRGDDVADAITYLLADLLDPVTAAVLSPVHRPLFEFTQPAVFVGIIGTQGIGKSCLLQCIAEQISTVAKCTANCNVQVLRGRHDRLGSSAPFFVWKNIIHDMIVRIHRVKKETPRRKKSFVVGLSVTPKELLESAAFVLSILPPALRNFFPLLGYLGVVPLDRAAMSDLNLSPQELTKCCVDLQIAIIQMFTSATKNVVLLTMDDIHAFDDSSLLLLMEVYAVSRGVVVLFTRRSSGPSHSKDSFASDDGSLVAQLASVLYEAGRFQAIELDCLDKVSTTALVRDALMASKVNDTEESLFDKVFEVCGGNPFYAFEVAKTVAEKQGAFSDKTLSLHSVRIEEVICHRFDKLKNSSQTLLKIAAVACSNGSSFTLAMLNEVGDNDNDNGALSPTTGGLEDAPVAVRNATILRMVLQNESFISVVSRDADESEEIAASLTVEMLVNGNHSFEFNVGLEQSIIYNLLLDDQKHAIHQSIAEYYKLRRESSEETTSVALYREEGFHWESACVMNHAMVCYYEAYVGDQDVPKNSDYLDKAFAMYNGMKDSTEVMPDPQGISCVNLQNLIEETFQNDGKSKNPTAQPDTLKLDRVFQIFDGDSAMLETALAVILEMSMQRIRRFEGTYFTQLILEDAIQMILLTKTPFLMSSKYLVSLVHSVTKGVCRIDDLDMHFCLYDHFSHFCLRMFSAYLLNYVASHSTAVELTNKAMCIGSQFLQLARGDEEPVFHLVQALCMNALIHNKLSDVKAMMTYVHELTSIYVFEEHSRLLIDSFASDQVIFLLARTAKYYMLSSEPEKAYGYTSACVKYATHCSDVPSLTCCIFRVVAVLAYAGKYVDAQMVWTKFDRVILTTKTHKREQVPLKVLQLYSEWLSRRILQLSHRRNPHISVLGRESADVNELVDHVELLMKMEHENAVYHYRHEVLLVFADIGLLKIMNAIEDSGKHDESIESLCKACCKHLQIVMSGSSVDTRDMFNKACCVKIAIQAVKLVSEVQSSQRCLHSFRTVFSSQVLLQLRNEAELNRLHSLFESLAALYQAMYGQHHH